MAFPLSLVDLAYLALGVFLAAGATGAVLQAPLPVPVRRVLGAGLLWGSVTSLVGIFQGATPVGSSAFDLMLAVSTWGVIPLFLGLGLLVAPRAT
jgi:hypothetical protein